MEEREVWIQASAILAEHAEMSADYIIAQVNELVDDRVAFEDWLRIAAAVDAITDTIIQ